jgi:hypothetical protein
MARAITIRIEGADEVIRALDKLPKDAQRAMRREAKDIATSLADFIKIAGRAQGGAQGARAASTVREGNEGFWPVITASNTGAARGRRPSVKGGGVLFGSVFGQTRKSGWYRKRRYFGSAGDQFRPHIDYPGYWFFKTAEERQPWIESEWHGAAEEVVRQWSA